MWRDVRLIALLLQIELSNCFIFQLREYLKINWEPLLLSYFEDI